MPIFKGPSLKTRAVSKNIRRYGERMKIIPFYKYMLLFFREKNNPILYPISSQHANLKVTEGKDSQRSLKEMSKAKHWFRKYLKIFLLSERRDTSCRRSQLKTLLFYKLEFFFKPNKCG